MWGRVQRGSFDEVQQRLFDEVQTRLSDEVQSRLLDEVQSSAPWTGGLECLRGVTICKGNSGWCCVLAGGDRVLEEMRPPRRRK